MGGESQRVVRRLVVADGECSRPVTHPHGRGLVFLWGTGPRALGRLRGPRAECREPTAGLRGRQSAKAGLRTSCGSLADSLRSAAAALWFTVHRFSCQRASHPSFVTAGNIQEYEYRVIHPSLGFSPRENRPILRRKARIAANYHKDWSYGLCTRAVLRFSQYSLTFSQYSLTFSLCSVSGVTPITGVSDLLRTLDVSRTTEGH